MFNPNKQIHFAEIAGNPILSLRAACSIESATHHHPDWTVTLYNVSKMQEDARLKTLLQIPNFKLAELNINSLFENTTLSNWYFNGVYKQSWYPVAKLSDALRLVLLWKKGGIYLDTDILVLRSMKNLRNCIGLEHNFGVNSAVLIFDKYSDILNRSMNRFLVEYTHYKWGTEGPILWTNELEKDCGNVDHPIPIIHRLNSYAMDTDSCQGVTIMPRNSFYPVPWPLWPELFSVISDYEKFLRCSYTVHLWNSLSKNRHSDVNNNNQLLTLLAKSNCPRIYESVMSTTGVGL